MTAYRHRFTVLVVLFASCITLHAAQTSSPPNILFILTDDQGWGTLSCYGSKQVPTPHLDSLAKDGARFTQAYAMPQCTPTRASLFTGQHTARNGMWHVIPWYGLPWARVAEPMFREQLPRDAMTLPKRLQAAGYRTGMAGKWHLTSGADGNYASLTPEAGAAYGFDFVAPPGPGSIGEGDKWVDHLTDQAIQFIRAGKDAPWFFYLAHHTIHGPVSAPDDLVKKHLAAGAPVSGLHNATYLAALEHLDNSVGRLLAALDEMKLRDNTLVVFQSDNGGVDTTYDLPEALDGSTPLKVRAQEFDNAPLRSGKGSPYEGGIRVPCLLRWPARVKGGQVCEVPVHVTDWLPTLLGAAGGSVPPSHKLDGVNLLPLVDGTGGTLPERPLYFYMPLYDLRWAATPCAAMRVGDWKLIEYFGDWYDENLGYHAGHRLELYDLHTDQAEARNLAESDRARASQMQAQLHAWLQSVPAPVPGENPHFDPKRMLEETKEKQAWNGTIAPP